MPSLLTPQSHATLRQQIDGWVQTLGFSQWAVSDIRLEDHEPYLQKWLDAGYHGSMAYMERHGMRRARPAELVPDTCRVITVRMNYLAADTEPLRVLGSPEKAYISRYALGRDYHKLMRKRLAQLAALIQESAEGGQYRAFVDSAPVLERALAERAGMGWIAKNTMLINERAGSWFFLGEIYTDLPLAADTPKTNKHCGSCSACLEICPTQAFVGPFELDARRCISYLTIEHHGSIDPALRPLMGNRVFGCDDCQLVCPWNKFAQHTTEADFQPRHGLQNSELVALFLWDEATFLTRTEGSAIRRIGHERWLRNLAVGLGNGPATEHAQAALATRLDHPSALVREHVSWALSTLRARAKNAPGSTAALQPIHGYHPTPDDSPP
ncbi:MAG: tRNA epoxyqueuosine(34) reductase QueG [Haliea sp.]|jgi:epoxyqueuosine reductase|nr:tRNA epoxyqueuosine(34) reductase QueG [Haliea sp.]MDP5064044.1 tRNA epoxyqueuosine(34) reductase QueG [Haliea sp.]